MTRRSFCLLPCIVICAGFIGTAGAASGPRSGGMFEAVPGSHVTRLPERALRGKSRLVRVNKGKLRSSRLQLNLGVGPDLEVLRESQAEHRGGKRSWIGRVKGDRDSEVILASSGGAVAGTIRHRGRLFKLEPTGNGESILSEVGPEDPFPEVDPIAVGDVVGGDVASGDVPAAQGDGDTVVDVMVVYTPASKTRYGGDAGIEALITLAVAETNQAYRNSQVNAQLRLVHTAEVGYTESGSMNTDLSNITGLADGVMDEVHVLRDAYGADLVSLFVESTDYCGLAWQIGGTSAGYQAYAFSVVYTQCATGYYSFGHELGHNMGSAHDHANSSSGLYAYSYGYQDGDSAFRTVMAYNCTSGCARVQHFSNPYVDYAGSPTGVADWADNARSLDSAAPLVATWREDPVGVALPSAPSDLNATAASHERIDLAWIDNASDESGFRVERSTVDGPFSEIASLAANATGYADAGLLSDTTYYYRVSAYNGAGSSGYSNDALATTGPSPVLPPEAPTALAGAANSDSEIALTWEHEADNETGIELERRLDGVSDWSQHVILVADSTAYLDQGLNPETAYSYRVRATGEGGSSAYSNEVTVTTEASPVYPPAVPTGMEAVAQSHSEISLTWIDKAVNETGYQVERSSTGGATWDSIASLGADVTSHSDQGLVAETYYLYRVRATGDGGPSGYSNEVGATTEAVPAPVECSVAGAATVKLDDKKFYWNLTNTGGIGVTIESVEITWPAEQGKLSRLRLGRDEIWRGSIEPGESATIIDSGWNAEASRRQIDAGETKEFRAEFKSRYKDDSPSDYSVAVRFAEDCRVEF